MWGVSSSMKISIVFVAGGFLNPGWINSPFAKNEGNVSNSGILSTYLRIGAALFGYLNL